MRSLPRNARAFTLIELLVVIVILGILMAVAVPTFLAQQQKAQDSRTEQYLTTAFKAIRAGTLDTGDQYPASTSMVSWIKASEPELTAQRGDCLTGVTSAPADAVLVDPSSTASSLQLCARSQSGNVWKLTATATSAQQLLNGTLVPLTVSGNEITDATRAADVQGDGLSSDSSTGIWEGTTNLVPNGGFESNVNGWIGSTTRTQVTTAMFGSHSMRVTGAPGQAAAYSIAASAGATYTLSAWVRGVSGGESVRVFTRWLDGSGATISDSSATNATLTTSFQRYVNTGTAPANTATAQIRIEIVAGTPTFLLDGVQLEQKLYATPYLETNGAASSRADGWVKIPISLFSATQGWVALRVRFALSSAQEPSAARLFDGRNSGNGNLGDVRWNTSGTWSTAPGGAAVSDSWPAGSYQTFVLRWTGGGATSQDLSLNGAPFAHGAAALSIPPSWFTIGNYGTGGAALDGDVLWFAIGTGTLTDTDAATINSWGNTDPQVSSFPTAAQAEMVWNAATSNGSLK